ncbi:hypothetical protein GCM10010365_11100 [Streptomyces poonensis]|uniref:Uncharacterized protein n=1 Tax=Streptomyces poonensis TaxID=68255 RepID=A0A918P9N7_9ACTN|nr:hypothetical protein GCM10010365_11100 [Streptomyces poonensis]GLJ87449.1 hypothetical protein GCM10017589_00490 [Streptomyces poonensis]
MRSVLYVMVSLFAVANPPDQRSDAGGTSGAMACRTSAAGAGRRRSQVSWRPRSARAWVVAVRGNRAAFA